MSVGVTNPSSKPCAVSSVTPPNHRTITVQTDRRYHCAGRQSPIVLGPCTQPIISTDSEWLDVFGDTPLEQIDSFGLPARYEVIERYSDHAANERTFLAWVRTGIALVAFGVVLEKFHFFLVKVESLGLGQDKHTGTHDTKAAGIILMVFGLVVLVGSIVRYLQTDAKIRDPNLVVYSTRASTLLGLTLLILGGFMLWAMIAL